jgi:hypothetical protein
MDFPELGGDEEDRTLDLTDANRTLSQTELRPQIIPFSRCEPNGCLVSYMKVAKTEPLALPAELRAHEPVAAGKQPALTPKYPVYITPFPAKMQAEKHLCRLKFAVIHSA